MEFDVTSSHSPCPPGRIDRHMLEMRRRRFRHFLEGLARELVDPAEAEEQRQTRVASTSNFRRESSSVRTSHEKTAI